jgi:hypothetical protein
MSRPPYKSPHEHESQNVVKISVFLNISGKLGDIFGQTQSDELFGILGNMKTGMNDSWDVS